MERLTSWTSVLVCDKSWPEGSPLSCLGLLAMATLRGWLESECTGTSRAFLTVGIAQTQQLVASRAHPGEAGWTGQRR